MKVRYKASGSEAESSRFNISGCGEVLTEDDSAFISELDVFVEAIGDWKDLRQAFKDRDIINDNQNTGFFEPQTQADKDRGYTL